MASTVAELDIVFNADTGNAQSAFSLMQDTLFRTAMAGQKLGGFIMDGVGSAIGSAIDLETEMNNVNSIAKVNQGQLAEWTDQVQALAVEWGQSAVDTASGMYQIQSAGFSAADSIQILESSSMAARAGLSTVEVASDAVTTVMKAYENQIGSTSKAYQQLNDAGEQAEYIQNVLFRGVDRGKVTYDQLAGAMGNSIATAATAGVTFEETTAAIALMTQQGLSADESSTALNNTMLAFLNPSDKMTEAVTSLGYANAATMLQTEGLAGAMQLLEDYTHGDATAIGELFTNIRSKRGAMLLMNGDLATMVEAMNDAQGGAGKLSAMQSALEEQTKSTSFALDVMHASFEVMGQELMQSLLPFIRMFAFAISDLAKFIINLPAPIKTFMGTLTALVGIFFSAAGAVALFLALWGPIVPLLAVLTAGILAVTTPLALLLTLFAEFGTRNVIQGFSDAMDALDVPFLDHFTNSIERAKEAWDRFTGLMQVGTGFVQLDGVAMTLGKLGAAIQAFADSTSGIDILDGPLGQLGDFLKVIAAPLQNALDLFDKLRGEGEYNNPLGAGGNAFYGGEAGGGFKRAYTDIRALRKTWNAFADDMYKTFPKQRELIGQLDSSVSGLLASIESAQMGNWDQAWKQFQESAQAGWEAVKTISQNIHDAFSGANWGAVYDAIGGALDSAFALLSEGVSWTVNVLAPQVIGWLADHADDAWDAIKQIAGWAADRFTEIVNWTIDVLVPAVIGVGLGILKNIKGWLIGQLGGGRAPGAGANYGVSGTNELGEMSLGSLLVKWIIDIFVPDVIGAGKAILADVKGWIKGQMGGGMYAPSGFHGMGGGSDSIDLGTYTASWTINVLEPELAGWISSAAGWLQGKLQDYVNGSGGYAPNGFHGMGGGGGGLTVDLAGWIINALDPLVNLTGADIHGQIQKEVDSLTKGAQFLATGIEIVISQVTGESVTSLSDIPAALQIFVNNTQKEYHKAVTLIADVSVALGGISFGGLGGSGGGGGYAPNGFHGMGTGGGAVEQFFHNTFGAGGDEFYKDISVIMNYKVTEIPGDAERILAAAKHKWETAEHWVKSITIDLKMILGSTDVPQVLQDMIDFVKNNNLEGAIPGLGGFIMALESLIGWLQGTGDQAQDTAVDINAVGNAALANAAYIGSLVKEFGPAPSGTIWSNTGGKLPVGGGAGGLFGQGPPGYIPPVQGPPAPPSTAAGEPDIIPTPVVDTNQVVAQARNVFLPAWQSGFQQVIPQIQQSGTQIQTKFVGGLGQGFTPAINTTTQGVGTQLGVGLGALAPVAGGAATNTVGSFGTGIAPLPIAAGTAGTGADTSLRAGVAPMPGTALSAGTGATGSMRAGLAPMPGQVGGIAQNTGSSFNRGIASGFQQAAAAARSGAAQISAAANSIGNLYGVGYSVGSSLGAGVAAGIWSQVGAVMAASAALSSAASAGAQARGQISSPSRLMFREVGVPLAQGVVAGIESQQVNVADAMANMVDFGRGGAYTLPRSKVIAIHNNHYYVLEPESWMEVQRDSKMAASEIRRQSAQARVRIRSKPQLSSAQ